MNRKPNQISNMGSVRFGYYSVRFGSDPNNPNNMYKMIKEPNNPNNPNNIYNVIINIVFCMTFVAYDKHK